MKNAFMSSTFVYYVRSHRLMNNTNALKRLQLAPPLLGEEPLLLSAGWLYYRNPIKLTEKEK
jgi:hypothetical protein